MDDWLIFQYHFIRAQAESDLLRGCLPFLGGEPTRSEEASDGGTQEGRSTQAMVVPGASA